MTSPRWDAVAAPLPDGRVLIAGGKTTYKDKSGKSTKTTEIFDPVTSTFSRGPGMNAPRAEFTATVLEDGRVVLAGGRSAEVFDPATNEFAATITLRMSRSAHSAVRVGPAKVLVAGGESVAAGGSVELIDVAAGRSTVLAARLNPPVNDHALAGLSMQRVVVLAGQRSDSGQTVNVSQMISLAGGEGGKATVRPIAARLSNEGGNSDMATATFGPLVLLAGGEADIDGVDTIAAQAWLFDGRSERFIATAPLRRPHDDVASLSWLTPLGFPVLFLIGGLTTDKDFGELPQRDCELLILLPNDELPPIESIARSGLGRVSTGEAR
jgi:hypothetical protein